MKTRTNANDVTLATADKTIITQDHTPEIQTSVEKSVSYEQSTFKPKTTGDMSYVMSKTMDRSQYASKRELEVKSVYADAPPTFWNKDEGSVRVVRCGKGNGDQVDTEEHYVHNNSWSPDVEDYRHCHSENVCDAF